MPKPPKKPSNVIPITVVHQAVRQDTGEVFDLEMAARVGRRRKSRRKVYALIDLEALDQIELSAAEFRVLARIMRDLNQETNQSALSLEQIATDCGMLRPSVSRVMHDLRARRIVYTLRRGVHRVNSHIVYRGSNQDWDIATDTEVEPIWSRST